MNMDNNILPWNKKVIDGRVLPAETSNFEEIGKVIKGYRVLFILILNCMVWMLWYFLGVYEAHLLNLCFMFSIRFK